MTTFANWVASGSGSRCVASQMAGIAAASSRRSAKRRVHLVRTALCWAHTVTHAAQISSEAVSTDASQIDLHCDPSSDQAIKDVSAPTTATTAITSQYAGLRSAVRFTGVASSQNPAARDADTGPTLSSTRSVVATSNGTRIHGRLSTRSWQEIDVHRAELAFSWRSTLPPVAPAIARVKTTR